MPFYNFLDTDSTKILYNQFLQQDNDGDLFEFITHDMLNMGNLFEDEDEDNIPETQKQLPVQTIQINPGFLICAQPLLVEKNEKQIATRVFCSFIGNNYNLDFSTFVFRPPAFIS